MTYVAWKVSGLPPHQVMGMAGVLDSARFQTFISMELGVSTADVNTTVLGSHGDLMVPIPRYSTVNGIPITELMDAATIERLIQRTRDGGAEIVSLMKTGSAFFAPASSTAVMVESILYDRERILPVTAYLQGEYGLKEMFLGVPCRLACRGIESVIKLELSDAELAALQTSAESVRRNIPRLPEVIDNFAAFV
jgi:malate dehydrogenase